MIYSINQVTLCEKKAECKDPECVYIHSENLLLCEDEYISKNL